MPSEPKHPQTSLRDWRGQEVQVDRRIAPLVAACWAADVLTNESCQESSAGLARLGFLGLENMERFYDLLTAADTDDDTASEWGWTVWCDGSLRGHVNFPASHIGWAAERITVAHQAEEPGNAP